MTLETAHFASRAIDAMVKELDADAAAPTKEEFSG
jgi:hypothetical protein